MQSTLTFGEADPHDVFVDDPEVVLAAHAERKRAAKASADLTSADSAAAEPAQDVMGALLAPQIHVLSDVAAKAPVPPVEPMLPHDERRHGSGIWLSGIRPPGV